MYEDIGEFLETVNDHTVLEADSGCHKNTHRQDIVAFEPSEVAGEQVDLKIGVKIYYYKDNLHFKQ